MHGSPQGSPVHVPLTAEEVPVPDNTPEEKGDAATAETTRSQKRNDAELAAAEATAKAEAALASALSDPFVAATSSAGSSLSSSRPKDAGSSSGGYVSNRADKYLPQLPVKAHQEVCRDRMREIEAWHGFLETMSSWLALQDEAYVNKIRLCIGVKDEIRQDLLPPDTAARSAKLFYLLSQSLAKWDHRISKAYVAVRANRELLALPHPNKRRLRRGRTQGFHHSVQKCVRPHSGKRGTAIDPGIRSLRSLCYGGGRGLIGMPISQGGDELRGQQSLPAVMPTTLEHCSNDQNN